MMKNFIINRDTDNFFLSLAEDEKESFRDNKGPTTLSKGTWHGEIKTCPKCKEVRVTSCSACGCGTCYTCGYKFFCYSGIPININYYNNLVL